MTQVQTVLDVADNSGMCRVMYIEVLGESEHRYTSVGDVTRVAVKDVAPCDHVKKGDVYSAAVVRTARDVCRSDDASIESDNDATMLLNSEPEPLSTRIFGPVTHELRIERPMKIVSLAPEVL